MEKTHLTAEGDRERGQASTGATTEAPGAIEQQLATESAEVVSSAKGQSSGAKKNGGIADTDRSTERHGGGEEGHEDDEEHKFSEWKVHPRWTPRKDTALQVTWHNLGVTSLVLATIRMARFAQIVPSAFWASSN